MSMLVNPNIPGEGATLTNAHFMPSLLDRGGSKNGQF